MKKILTFVLLFVCILSNVLYVQAADSTEVYYCDSGTILYSYTLYEPPVLYDQYINFHNTQMVSVYIEDLKQVFLITPEPATFHAIHLRNGNDPSKQIMSKSQTSNSPIYTYNGVNYQFPFNVAYSVMQVGNGNITSHSFDKVYSTMNDFCQALQNYKDIQDYIDKESGGVDDGKLPMLHYKLSSKNVVSFPNIIDKKISIDWDFSDIEPYASNPMGYALEIIISAHFYPNSEGQRICWDASKTSINEDCKRIISGGRSLLEKPYSFIYLKEGDELYKSSNHIFATDELQDGYYLYIRSYAKDGSKSSNYKVYKCTTGGTSGQMDMSYDTDGNRYDLDESDRDDDSDYSNEYDEDSSSSADEDPTGDSYDGNGGYSFNTLYANLKAMVNMLQGVPELWSYVMSWLPAWFPIFIVSMMGLLIVIGVLKYIF